MATFRSTPGPSGDPLAEATELTKRLKLPYLRRALTDLIPTAKAQTLGTCRSRPRAAGRGSRRPRCGQPAHPPQTRRLPRRQNLPRLGRVRLLRPAAHPGRPENPGMGPPQGKPLHLRPQRHRKSHFCEAIGQTAIEAGLAVAWFTIRPRHPRSPPPPRRFADTSHDPTDPFRTHHRRRHRPATGLPRRRRRLLPPRRRRLRTPGSGRQLQPPPLRLRRDMPKTLATAPSTDSCTTPTSWSPTVTASGSPKPPPARG